MKIIVISNSEPIENESEIITKLFESGLETLHLRKPKYSTRQLKDFIKKIPSHFHNRIIIHSHHNLARKFDLKGIHITKTHRNRKIKTWLNLKLLKLKKPNAMVSTSHSRLAGLFEEEGKYDYVFLSPVFDSLSGKYQAGFTEQGLRSAVGKISFEIIARGGVDADCIEKAQNIGFAGVALFSSIWKKPDPVSEFNKVAERCLSLGIKIE